jgi:methyltransferase (TIGR00027 family)
MRRDAPSYTARVVASVRAQVARPSLPTGDSAAEARLYASLKPPLWKVGAVGRSRLVARTRFFDDAVLDAIGAKIRQIVILGAGYDGRAFRFRTPGTHFFEVDHPVTQADKLRRVRELGLPTDHVSYVALDMLCAPLGDKLEAAGHEPTIPTAFLCEGLLLYLPRTVIESLLRAIRARSAPGSRLVVSARETLRRPKPSDRVRRRAARLAFSAIGEPVRSTFRHGELSGLLATAGFGVGDVEDATPAKSPRGPLLLTATVEAQDLLRFIGAT